MAGYYTINKRGGDSMVILNVNKPHLITLSTLSENKKIERFPNQLIWDINSFLMQQFDLYELYFSQRKESELSFKISKFFSFRNKYLCFDKLNEMYKGTIDYNEEELYSEYLKHKDEFTDFNAFKEIYLMETINELNYVAVDDFKSFYETVDKLREKNLKSSIYNSFPVCIFIGDHDWMEIHIRDLKIQKSLNSIISKHII